MKNNKVLKCYLRRPSTGSSITYRLPAIPRNKVAKFIRRHMPGWELGSIFEIRSDEQRWPKKEQEHPD
jgi:hypothetical protein